jgi:hypothetical protein
VHALRSGIDLILSKTEPSEQILAKAHAAIAKRRG